MTATTRVRNTSQLDYPTAQRDSSFEGPLAAAVSVLAGTIAVMDSAGNLRMGRASTTDKAVGVFDKSVDNSAGAAGALHAKVLVGVFNFANSAGGEALAEADRLTNCYVVDNQTVGKTSASATLIKAGPVVKVDSEGVWVAIGMAAMNGTALA
jgi:hypothetical protein